MKLRTQPMGAQRRINTIIILIILLWRHNDTLRVKENTAVANTDLKQRGDVDLPEQRHNNEP